MRAVLKGIQDTPLVLKGGTALMMAYGLDRFSEDLDFDAPVKLNLESRISKSVPYDVTLIGLDRIKNTDTVSRYRLTYRVGGEQGSLKIEISYRNPPPDSEIRFIHGVRFTSLARLVSLKLKAAHDGDTPRSAVRDLYDLDFIARRYPAVFDESLSARLLAYASNPEAICSRYRADHEEDDLISDLIDLEELALRISDNATEIHQHLTETHNRLSNFPKLKDAAGVALSFWRLGTEAISDANGRVREVDWKSIEQSVIDESIGKSGQSQESVQNVLCCHSPSAASVSQQTALRKLAQERAPELQVQYLQSKGVDPENRCKP